MLNERFPKIKEILDAENFYSVFNTSQDAETAALHAKYKNISRIVHPDKIGQNLETESFKDVSKDYKEALSLCSTEAFKILKKANDTFQDPNLKRIYDINYWTRKIEETREWLESQTLRDDLSPSEKDFIEQSCDKLVNTIEEGIERIRNNRGSNIMQALESDLQGIEAG